MYRIRAEILAAAAAVFGVVALRAAIQAVTIDEAETFSVFVSGPLAFAWAPAANNHVLNTLLMKLSVAIFGAHPFTLRLPALVGAALYIYSALRLSARMGAGRVTAFLTFVALTANPLVLDYLVAARGYALATGLLLCAVAQGWELVLEGRRAGPKRYAAISVLLGLAVTANFSYALIAAVMTGGLALVALSNGERRVATGAAALLPGIGVAGGLTGYTLARWPAGQFTYGAHSLAETFSGIVSGSFSELPANVPAVIPLALLAMLAVAVAVHAWMLLAGGPGERDVKLLLFAAALCCCAGLALGAHWTWFRMTGTPLPHGRTALWLVVLATAGMGAVLAAGPNGRARTFALAPLALCVAFELACLRFTYFKEWKWNADMESVYAAVAAASPGQGAVCSSWMFRSSLGAYRILEQGLSVGEVAKLEDGNRGCSVYVLRKGFDDRLERARGLRRVYDGPYAARVAVPRAQ